MIRRLLLAAPLWLLPTHLAADPPQYHECRLDSIFPAGGQVGQTVTVDFHGYGGGLDGARQIVIDGPPGITVEDIKNVNSSTAQAKLKIAADAAPGRRYLRVASERSGLTNFAWFVVGRLPEINETEPNQAPQAVSIPVVVNGRVNPGADVDAYSFAAKAGQTIVAAVAAHAIDAHGQSKNWGIADASLQVLDAKGRIVAEAEDTLGLDPLVHFTVPSDGQFVARVQLLNYGGFPEAVYRLTLGEVPVVTSVFPPGGQRGTTVDVEFFGPNIPSGTRGLVEIPATDRMPSRHIFPDLATAGNHDVPFAQGDEPEAVEAEPNDDLMQANPLTWPRSMSGRFQSSGDLDWYRLALKKGETILLETAAHRSLRSPVDTLIQVCDASGKVLAENDDDATPLDYVSIHDHKTPDSRLSFQAPGDGDFLVRVSDQAGAFGERCVYRLTATEALPDFRMVQFPDCVPVWGPGSTAALLVRIDRFHGFNGEVQLQVKGLPEGWTGSTAVSPPSTYGYYYGAKTLLTITAPAEALPGATAAFEITGTAKIDGREIQRVAQPVTLFYTTDIGFFRVSPKSRAAVTRPHPLRFEALTKDLTISQGSAGTLPVRIHGQVQSPVTLVASVPNNGVACTLGTPEALPVKDGLVEMPIKTEQLPPGTHSLVVSGRWGADIRVGMPGPCTSVVLLHVKPK